MNSTSVDPLNSNFPRQVLNCYTVGDAHGLDLMEQLINGKRWSLKKELIILACVSMILLSIGLGLRCYKHMPLSASCLIIASSASLGVFSIAAALDVIPSFGGSKCDWLDKAERDVSQKRALEMTPTSQWTKPGK